MKASVTPKGVEHPGVIYAGNDGFYVKASVTPKGVEHNTRKVAAVAALTLKTQ